MKKVNPQIGSLLKTVLSTPQPSERIDAAASILGKSRLPKRHDEFRIAQNTQPEWLDKYEKLYSLIADGGMVALIGNRGSGKTQMSVLVAKRLAVNLMRTSLYCKMIEFFMGIKATYGQDKTEEDAISGFCVPNLLIVDDVHNRSESSWEDQLLTYLLDKRYDCMKPTILISNMKHEEFQKSIGASVYDRLCETGGIMECSLPSFRRKS